MSDTVPVQESSRSNEVRETSRAGTLFSRDKAASSHGASADVCSDQKNLSTSLCTNVSVDEKRNQNIILKMQKAEGQLNSTEANH